LFLAGGDLAGDLIDPLPRVSETERYRFEFLWFCQAKSPRLRPRS
jgi:hypothetical protein